MSSFPEPDRSPGPDAVAGNGAAAPSSPSAGPWAAVARADEAVDRAFERIRGNAPVDTAALVISNLGDYGFVWAVAAGVKGFRKGDRRRRARRHLTVAGMASAGTNWAVKQVVARPRPEPSEEGAPAMVRRPRTTSFPSGHTLAAFCTAVVLADGPRERAAYLTFASAVGLSRLHLRHHHASDVLGGAAIGTLLGVACRKALGPT
jgi:undecaprenyl-diphosphatase